MILKTTLYIFVAVIVALFMTMFMLAVYSGAEPFAALVWSVANLLNIAYPGLIPYGLAVNSDLILIADTLGAISFALLAALLAAIFYSFIRNLNLRQHGVMRKIGKLRKHAIIFPFNSFAEAVALEMERNGIESVVITKSEREAKHLYMHGKLAMVGDINKIELLKTVGLRHAGSVVLCSEDPTENALAAITVRTFNRKVKIIARVGNEEDLPKLSKAGVHMVILPEVAAGNWLGKVISEKVSKD